MINRILMELYNEYINNNIEPLKEFAKKTFNTKEISELFICCTLIMFSQAPVLNQDMIVQDKIYYL